MTVTTMKDMSLADAATIADFAYRDTVALPLGYSFVRDLAITPFYSAKVVQVTGTNTFVIALKGTSNAYDLFQDGDIAKGVRPDVAVAAYAAITQFIQDNPNTNIILDGHSLGAFVSTDVAAPSQTSRRPIWEPVRYRRSALIRQPFPTQLASISRLLEVTTILSPLICRAMQFPR